MQQIARIVSNSSRKVAYNSQKAGASANYSRLQHGSKSANYSPKSANYSLTIANYSEHFGRYIRCIYAQYKGVNPIISNNSQYSVKSLFHDTKTLPCREKCEFCELFGIHNAEQEAIEALDAIETEFDNWKFRSRAEARWAVFFKTLGLRYTSELDAIILPSGCYIPDFYLPDVGCWIEVKGTDPTQEEKDLARELAEQSAKPVFIFTADWDVPLFGKTPGAWAFVPCPDSFNPDWSPADEDANYYWCECPECHTLGITYQGRVSRLPCDCGYYAFGVRKTNVNTARLRKAYEAAKKFRFEWKDAA